MHLKTPQVGFEPTTNRLTVDRSATELLRISSLDICHNNESQNNWQVFCQKYFPLINPPDIKDILEIKRAASSHAD